MKKFLAIYQSSPESQQQMANATEEEKKAVMDAWWKWKSNNEQHIVDFGAPTMPVALLGGAQASGNVGGYSLLQASSLDELKAAFASHPHQNTELFELMDM